MAKKKPTIPLDQKCAVDGCNREGQSEDGVLLCTGHLIIRNICGGWKEFCKEHPEIQNPLERGG